MLGSQRIIPAKNAAAILDTLLKLQNDWYENNWTWIPSQEDVHMNVEKKVIDALGMDVGGRMHTCRSRNDQVNNTSMQSEPMASQTSSIIYLLLFRLFWTASCTPVGDFLS